MRKLRRILLRIGVGLTIVAIACAIAGLLVVRSGWFQEQVRERIISEIELSTGARVEIGNFDFDWEHLSATVSSLAVHGKEPAGEAPLLAVQSITLGLRVISMFERKVDLSFLRLERPVLRIVFYPDGSTNFIPPHDRTTWAEDLLDVAVRRYEVADGIVEYDDRKIPLNLRGENLRASMTFDRRGPRYRGELAMRHVRMMAGGSLPLDLDASTQFVIEKSRLEFTRMRIATGQSRADLSGALNDVRAPRGTLSFKAVIAVRDAVAAFLLPITPTGSAAVNGQVSIAFAKVFDFSLNARVNARGLGYTHDRLKIEGADLRGDMRVTLDGVNLKGVTLTALGSTVSGSANLTQWKQFHSEGTIQGLGIRDAARIATDRPIPWSGTMSGIFSTDATIGEPSAKVQASIAIAPGVEGTPINGEIDALYDQGAGTLRLQNCRLASAGTQISATGTLGERLEIHAQSTHLEDLLPALAMASEDAPKELPVELLPNGRAGFNGAVSGSLDDPTVAGQVVLTNTSVDGHRFDRFMGDVEATRREVKLQRLTLARGATVADGSAQISGSFEDGAIAARLNVRNAQLAELTKEAGVTQPISGTAAASIRLSGSVREPEAEISMQVEKLSAFGEQMDRLNADVKYSASRIDVTSGEVSGTAGKATFQGSYKRGSDWKGGDAAFDIATQNVTLSRVQTIAKLQPLIDATVTGKANGAGRVSNGEFSLTAINGAATARGVSWDHRFSPWLCKSGASILCAGPFLRSQGS